MVVSVHINVWVCSMSPATEGQDLVSDFHENIAQVDVDWLGLNALPGSVTWCKTRPSTGVLQGSGHPLTN